ncbi:MAG: oligosaccharide flippase family protein [Acidobacteriota bacterium]
MSEQDKPEVRQASADATRPRSLLLNTLSSQGVVVMEALTIAILMPLWHRVLGKELVGLWLLIWSVISFFRLVDLGLEQVTVKMIADARSRGSERMRQVTGTLFWAHVTQGVLIVGLTALCLLLFSDAVGLDGELREMTQRCLLIIGFGQAFAFPFMLFRSTLVAHQLLRISNGYRILGSILYLGGNLLVLTQSPKLETLALLNLLVALLPHLLGTIHAVVRVHDLSLSPRSFRLPLLKEAWGFSLYFTIISLSLLMGSELGKIIVKLHLDLAAVAAFGLAAKIQFQAQNFCNQVARTLTPVIAELHGAGDDARIRRIWLRGTKLSVAFTMPLMVGCIVLAEPLVLSWMTESFIDAVAPLQILLIASLINVIHGNSHIMLSMRGDQRLLAWALFGGQVLNLVLMFVFLRTHGLIGMAWAAVLSLIPMQCFVIQGHLQRREGVSALEFYRKTVVPSLLPVGVMALALWLLRTFTPLDHLIEVGLAEGFGVVLFWALFWFFGFDDEERARLRAELDKVKARVLRRA